ncbi:pineapple eye protein-like [Pezoporus flaviventris]|uniref:pineapple eye protein-like n=1 Tax=Pezoporus flaviventris TaxID=889875 RepID=UPI002AB16B76|nr:pineapple eye protein-like [Pezoporus flaviventris]
MEHECILCCRVKADPDMCGPKLRYQGIYAHHLCLLFASDLRPQGTEQEEVMEFLPEEVDRTAKLAARMVCFVCGKRGATITCQETGCDRRFHLPCAVEGECVTRYLLPYSSFCWEHRPQQQELAAPEDANCLICKDPVEGRTTYGTMVCPACKHAWFHRACIQGQAMNAGAFSLVCPLCQNRRLFLTEMLSMGIRLPVRKASWEDNDASTERQQRHASCDARECLCPGGRRVAEQNGPWQLFLCRSCAAEGTHRRCSNLTNSYEGRWQCDSCAGLGTSKCQSTRVTLGWGQGSGKAQQRVPGVSLAQPVCSRRTGARLRTLPRSWKTIPKSTASPAAPGQSPEPQTQETSSPSSSRQMPSAPFPSCPVSEGCSCSSQPGPDRRQHQTRGTRQTQAPYTWPRRLQERSRPPATRAASNTSSQAVPRLSQCSPPRETRSRSTTRQQPSAASHGPAPLQGSRSNRAGGPMRVRDRSRLQRRAQAPYARPRRRSQGSHTPAARAGRSPRRLAAPRRSQGSRERASHSHSTTRQRPSASSRGSRTRQRDSASGSTGPVQV